MQGNEKHEGRSSVAKSKVEKKIAPEDYYRVLKENKEIQQN